MLPKIPETQDKLRLVAIFVMSCTRDTETNDNLATAGQNSLNIMRIFTASNQKLDVFYMALAVLFYM